MKMASCTAAGIGRDRLVEGGMRRLMQSPTAGQIYRTGPREARNGDMNLFVT